MITFSNSPAPFQDESATLPLLLHLYYPCVHIFKHSSPVFKIQEAKSFYDTKIQVVGLHLILKNVSQEKLTALLAYLANLEYNFDNPGTCEEKSIRVQAWWITDGAHEKFTREVLVVSASTYILIIELGLRSSATSLNVSSPENKLWNVQ